MTELLQGLVEAFPNLAGLIVLAAILYRQNDKLLGELFERIDLLERQVADLKSVVTIVAQRQPTDSPTDVDAA